MKQDYIDMINRKIAHSPNFANSPIAKKILNPEPIVQSIVKSVITNQMSKPISPNLKVNNIIPTSSKNIFSKGLFPLNYVSTDNGITYHAPS